LTSEWEKAYLEGSITFMPHGTVKVGTDCFLEYLNNHSKKAIPVGQRDPDSIKAIVPKLSLWQALSDDWHAIVRGQHSNARDRQKVNVAERHTKDFIKNKLQTWFGNAWGAPMSATHGMRWLDAHAGPVPQEPRKMYLDNIESMRNWFHTFGTTLTRIGGPVAVVAGAAMNEGEDDEEDDGDDSGDEEGDDGELWDDEDGDDD